VKNIIFQYMVTNEDTASRGKVPEYKAGNGDRVELYRKTADLSAESFRIYAEKIGATHHYSKKQVYTAGKSGSTVLLFECLRCIYDEMYDEFDQLLFVDTDIIANTEENIFELAGDYDVCGVYESDIRSDTDGGYNSWDYDDKKRILIEEKYARHGIPVVPTSPPQRPSSIATLNTGVLIWSRDARLRAREVFDPWYDYVLDGIEHDTPFWLNNDQPWISGQLVKHGFSVLGLDQTWNDTPTHYRDWHGDYGEGAMSAYDKWKNQNFLHYTGGGNKVEMLRHHQMDLFKYI
jgi:hypothetical protein